MLRCSMRTGRGEPIISDADWDAIFFGFDDIYRFQHRMLQELEAEWNSQLAVAAAEKLQPPEGVCYKQRPTVRTWPARYRRQSMSLAILPLILQSSVLYRDFLDRFEQVRPDRGQSVQCVSDCTLARDILLFALEFELS